MTLIHRLFDFFSALLNKLRGVEPIEPLIKIGDTENPSLETDGANMVDNTASGSAQTYFDDLLTAVFGDGALLDAELPPTYVIKGSGSAWYYNPHSRGMSCVSRGSEVTTVPGRYDSKGRAYVYVGELLLTIPQEDLIEIGYN